MQQSVTLALTAGFFSFILPAELEAVGDSGTPPSARSCFMASLLLTRGASDYVRQGKLDRVAYLKLFCPRWRSRPTSIFIFTQRYISSVPPW